MKKTIKSGMSYQQALDEFTANGKPWGDYYEMQVEWTAFIDNLERDGLVDYEEAKLWDNPCTPKEFNEWAGRTSDDTYDDYYDDGIWDEEEKIMSNKSIKSSVRDDFANRLDKLMKHYSLSFSSGSLEDNMIDIYDNYVSQYYDDELKQKGGAEVANDWFHNTYPDDEESIFIQNSRKSIKSSVRDDFARGLQNIMKHEGAEFAEGTLEDNMVDIYDNYVSQYYADELEEKGGVKVATEWFRNTYPDDEEGMFIHNSRKPIKSEISPEQNKFNWAYNDWFGHFQMNLDRVPQYLEGIKWCDANKGTSEYEQLCKKYNCYPVGDREKASFYNALKQVGAITSSKKPIKSSLEDRLIPYLEEFEEGYADTINRDAEEDSNGAYEEAFVEGFKNDYNLTDEDIEKLKEAVHNIWNESAEDEIRDMGEMYGLSRGASSEEALKFFESKQRKTNKKSIKSEFEIGDEVVVNDESKDLNEVEGTVTDIVDDKAEVVFKSGEDSWVDLDKIESGCHGKSKKDKKKKPVKSAMPGREKSIRAIMDEYGCSWEEAEEIMNDEIDSGCYSKSKKGEIKSSPNFKEFTADEIFDTFNTSQLTGTVFMDRDECKEARCGMGEFTDFLMYDVVPTYLGVQTPDDVREVCRRAKNPKAKAFLEEFETALENAKFTDKFYDSIKIHKKGEIKSSLRKENMDSYIQYRDDLFHAINEVDKKYNMSGRGPLATKEDFDSVIEWMDVHDYWNDDID